MKLNLESLQKALSSLDQAINRSKSDLTDDIFRDAVIQRFVRCHGVCLKLLRRQLEEYVLDPRDIEGLKFEDIIREGAERRIITDAEPWIKYREKRNNTAHEYDAEQAIETYKTAVEFSIDATDLLKELERRNL